MLVDNSPPWLIDIMTIFGNPMPLIGFAILMKLLVKNPTDLIFFTVGFAFVGVLGVDKMCIRDRRRRAFPARHFRRFGP